MSKTAQDQKEQQQRPQKQKIVVSVEAKTWKKKLEDSVKDVEEWNLEQKENFKRQVRGLNPIEGAVVCIEAR